jgi:hypothetical protein
MLWPLDLGSVAGSESLVFIALNISNGDRAPTTDLFYFLGWVPPTSTNHRVGPAHTLFSAAEYYIGIYRICQEKNFIYFELLALHLVP